MIRKIDMKEYKDGHIYLSYNEYHEEYQIITGNGYILITVSKNLGEKVAREIFKTL